MKKVIIIAVMLTLVATIPLLVFFIQKQQDLRSRAAPATTIRFSPNTVSTTASGAQFDVQVQVNTGPNLINGAALLIKFPQTQLEVVNVTHNTSIFTSGASFTILTNIKNNDTGNIDYSFYTLDGEATSPTSGDPWITVATVTFRPKANGSGNVTFDSRTAVVASNESTNVLIGGTDSQVAVTVGGGGNSPSPTQPAGNSPTPTTGGATNTLTPTLTGSRSPTPTGSITRTPTPTNTSGANNTSTPTPTSAPSNGSLTITYPGNNATVSSKRPTIQGTSKNNSTITVVINSSDPITGVTTANSTGNWSYAPNQDLSEGHHTLSVTEQATDGTTRSTSSGFFVQTTATPQTGIIENTIIMITVGMLLLVSGFVLL